MPSNQEREPEANPTDKPETILNEAIRYQPIHLLKITELFDKSQPGEPFMAILRGISYGEYGPSMSILYGSRAVSAQEAFKNACTFCKKLNKEASQKGERQYWQYWPMAIASLETSGFCLSEEEIQRTG